MNVFDYISMSIDINKSFFFEGGLLKKQKEMNIFTIKLKKDSKKIHYECLFVEENKIELRMVYDDNSKHFKKIGVFSKEGFDLNFKSYIKTEYKLKSKFSLYSKDEKKKFLISIINFFIKNNSSFLLESGEVDILIDYLYELKLSSFLYFKSKDSLDYPPETLFLIISNERQYIMFEKYNDILEHNLFSKELRLSKFQKVIKNSRYEKNIIKKTFIGNNKKDELDIIINDFILESENYFNDLFGFIRRISYFYETNLRGML